MCFLSDTSSFDTDPVCGAVGSTTELNSDARVRDGDASQCTGTADADGRVKLEVKKTAQDHLRVRHCLYADDTTSPVKEHSFSGGSSDLTLIGFWILAVLATLLFILGVLAWNNRRSGSTATGWTKTMYGFTSSKDLGGPWIFIIVVALLAGGASWLAHVEWGDHTEFYVVVSIAGVYVVALAGLLFMESRGVSLESSRTVAEDSEFLPRWDGGRVRPMRVMSLNQ